MNVIWDYIWYKCEKLLILLIRVLAIPLWIQVPTYVLGKTAEDGLSTWTPATHMEDVDGVPGSWLQPA